MEALGVVFWMLGATIEIMAGICHLGAISDEKPVRPRREWPGEANPPLDGRAIAGYVAHTSERSPGEGGTFLATTGKPAHPLWDREVDG